MSNRKIALVTWTDAYFSDTLPKEINMLRTTCGFLIQNNSRVVRIAQTLDERGPGDILSVPRGMVRTVKLVDAKTLHDEQLPEDETEPSAEDERQAARGY